MAKSTTQYVCQACSAVFPKWVGRCTSCAAWNTLVEEVTRRGNGSSGASLGGGAGNGRAAGAVPVSAVDVDHAARLPTGIGELDRVLGGGAVLGGVTLLGGDPGVGKSTLLLQALAGLAARGCRSLYVSGEESAGQTAARARRIAALPDRSKGASSERDDSFADALLVLAENDLDAIERVVGEVKPVALVLDSVQTVRSPSLESAAGTVSQLREVAARMVERAKRDRIATFLVGHVTKDGSLAGPKVLEHLVDTVLAFEGERGHAFRALRAQKNRFGSATEVGVFEMTAEGMREVRQPSALFLAERPRGVAGSVIAATSEGSRSMLVEVQALVGAPGGGSARRTANGVDSGRLAMILAVLERKAGLHLSGADVFVNVAGGVRVDEPAVDLAVALAIASSLRERPVPPEVVAFGEIGLAGEVRSVPRAAARIAESAAMGFTRAIVPASASSDRLERSERSERGGESEKLELVAVRTIEEAIAAVL
ncbi:MAG TPA: DNA repair protein RadA [Polyangiaceae bacterium]|jgi:DNA repair protein RadA/Sms